MADDSFFREVNEEMRSEKAKAVWRRFGPVLIGAAVAIVLGTAGMVAYRHWSASQAAQSGDKYLAALDLADQGKNDEALAALTALEKDGYGDYPDLARMRAAAIILKKGDAAGAVAAYDKIAADSAIGPAIQDIARLRAAFILVDTGSYDDVAKRVEPLTADGNPLRFSAREALGLAAWKASRTDDATRLFQQISDDQATPPDIRQRAGVMLDLIHSSGAVKKS
jgi:hypothetical protein